ncbi:MAG: hypothetical protein ABIT76_09120 [Chthoniobacterales bacterium]
MDKHLWLELIGYAASGIIAVSLMMSSILRLRLINSAGALIFLIYGLLIGAYPVAVLNGIIVVVNAFYLWKIFHTREYFKLLVLHPESQYLPYFLNFYREEIRRVVPDFTYQPHANQLALFILRDAAPVGVFMADVESGGVLRVLLDFVIPQYRSLKMGRFLFVEQADFFRERGVREIIIAPQTVEFGDYLARVGFESAPHGLSFTFRYANTP